MLVLLDRKCFESALPDMPAGMIVTQVAPYVGLEKPAHPAAKVAVTARPENQVEVIGPETVCKQPHRASQRVLGHDVKERVEIVALVEDLSACVPPIENVVAVAGG